MMGIVAFIICLLPHLLCFSMAPDNVMIDEMPVLAERMIAFLCSIALSRA